MIIRILLFLALCGLSVLSMTIGDTVEMRIVNLYLSDWYSAGLLYRIVILVMLYTAFAILFGSRSKVIKVLLIAIIAFTTIDTTLYLSGSNEFLSLFIHPFKKNLSYFVFAVLLGTSLLFIKEKKESTIKNWVYAVILIPVIGLSFIRVVYIDDWVNVASNNKNISLETAKFIAKTEGLQINENEFLMPFFSTSCGYCRLAAIKMSISNKNGTLPPTYIVFPSNKEKARTFMEETNLTDLNYITIPTDSFVKYGGVNLPSVFYLDQNGSTQWVGEKFNNIVLSNLSK